MGNIFGIYTSTLVFEFLTGCCFIIGLNKGMNQIKTDSVILYIVYSSYYTHFGVWYICVLIVIILNPAIIHGYLRTRQFIQ